MKEYKIRFTNEKISLFKTDKPISSISKKLNLLEATSDHMPAHFSLVKERRMNYVPKIYSFGAKTDKTYIGRILHTKREIIISEVEYIYRFNNQFTDIKRGKQAGDMAKKITKEELEHRRKNINYILRKINAEDEKSMKYLTDEEVEFTDEPMQEECGTTQTHDDHKIRRCIKEAKIVNYKVLTEIFPTINNIVEIMSEMCFNLHGRYVLKNKYYAGSLKRSREAILKQFTSSSIVFARALTKDEQFLLSEICNFSDNVYHLKGFAEDIQLQSSNVDIKKLIITHGIINMDKLKEMTELDSEDILAYMAEHSDIVKLQNNCYVIRHSDNIDDPRNIVIDLLMTRNNVKRNDIFTAVLDKTGKELNIFVYNKIMKEFCTAKGNNWTIKK